ncbi:hypothetical protein PAPHI01_1470 [Pancytospora philotis]|nr:hypothetical protein PAPHI01_1470 [Pancytospora philotis]
MLFCCLLCAHAIADHLLSDLSSVYIHILFAHHPQYALAESLNSPGAVRFLGARDAEGYSRKARIRQDGDSFRVEINGHMLCANKERIVGCPTGDLYTIVQGKFGYAFRRGDLCLTASPELELAPCGDTHGNQEFVFVNEALRYCYEEAQAAVPRTLAEKVKRDAIVEKAFKDPRVARKAKRKPSFEAELKKLKASPKMQGALSKLWTKGWGSGHGRWPSLSLC